jgi:hypothetical protein
MPDDNTTGRFVRAMRSSWQVRHFTRCDLVEIDTDLL